MSKALTYITQTQALLETIKNTQLENVEQASRVLATALENGKKIFTFGTGHSHILAEEIFYRAGGLVRIYPMLESALMLHESASKSSVLERMADYGTALFDHYEPGENDVLLIFSNSGRNAAAIELAKLCAGVGVHVIVITNLNHAATGASRHASGKKLHDFGEIVLDNCGCVGDASVAVDGLPNRVAPTSTVTGALLLNAMVACTVQYIIDDGQTPEVFASSNIDGGDAVNTAYIQKYKKEIRSL